MSKPPRELRVVGAAIIDGDRCLTVRRGAQMTTPGKWEFPGGKIEDGESPATALRREIQEELGLEIEVRSLLGTSTVLQNGRQIVLDVFLAARTEGTLTLREHSGKRWIAAGQVYDLEWAPADIPILPQLQAWLENAVATSPAGEETVPAASGAIPR